jgi:peptide/nickel transport system permease protein
MGESRAPSRQPALVHVLANILLPLLVQARLAIGQDIVVEASLSALGQPPPDPSWGAMPYTAQRFLGQVPFIAIPRDWRSSY